MATQNSILHSPAMGSDAKGVFGAVTTSLRHAAAGAGRGLKALVKRMQIARMQTVLNAMSDEQLREIELDRKDIPKRAHLLVNYTYDGL